MKLTIDDIRNITTGVADIVYEEEYECRVDFFRFTDRELKVMDNKQMFSAAGIQMKFKTDGRLLKLRVNTRKTAIAREYFSFDIFVNKTMIGTVQNMREEERVGNYASNSHILGSYSAEFELGDGEKNVRIVFPHSVSVGIEEMEISDATYIEPVKRSKSLIAYGDSITQGFDALHPSKTYISMLADALEADIINKAIGGICFCPELVMAAEDLKPDYITVAYGTNDWSFSPDLNFLRENTENFLAAIKNKYPDTPVIVITPVWRADWDGEKNCGRISDVENIINDVFGKCKNIMLISGAELIPHDKNLFGDMSTHPNDEGFEYYYNNLIKGIGSKD